MNHAIDGVAIPNPRVMVQSLDGEAVLLDLDTETYFGMNETAARLWALIAGGRSIRQALDTMAAEYDTPRPTLEADVLELVGELERLGLLRLDRA